MQPSTTLVRPEPYSLRATTTSSHPQLRDLLAYIPEAGIAGGIASVCYDSICSVDCYASAPPEYTPRKFSPSVIAAGMGLIATGGQSSEIALKSATPGSDWCFQHLPTASLATATGVRTLHSGSINNGIFICPAPTSPETPRVLVSSNDEVIKVFEVEGRPPDHRAARRRRERERRDGWSVVEATWAAERGESVCGPGPALAGPRRLRTSGASHPAGQPVPTSDQDDDDDVVEEQPSYDEGSACRLVPRSDQDIRLSTAVNHCSVSPDGKWLIAVGDTNEVFLYSVPRTDSDQYELAHTFTASTDASFSTDWNEDNQTFAVASQDGFVHVFDIRSLPSCSRPASPTLRAASASPRKVAELKTSQGGPAGAARKVKFSPGGRKIDAGLMAFTEHRNRVHIVDARTFETYQVLDVPLVASTLARSAVPSPITTSWNPSYVPSAAPPPLRPRPQPPPRTFRSRSRPSLGRLPSASFTSLASFDAAGGGSGTCTPRDEKERDDLEREMRERSERRARDEDRRVRALANEIRRERRRRIAAESSRRHAPAAAHSTGASGDAEAATMATVLAATEGSVAAALVFGRGAGGGGGPGDGAEVEADDSMDLDDEDADEDDDAEDFHGGEGGRGEDVDVDDDDDDDAATAMTHISMQDVAGPATADRGRIGFSVSSSEADDDEAEDAEDEGEREIVIEEIRLANEIGIVHENEDGNGMEEEQEEEDMAPRPIRVTVEDAMSSDDDDDDDDDDDTEDDSDTGMSAQTRVWHYDPLTGWSGRSARTRHLLARRTPSGDRPQPSSSSSSSLSASSFAPTPEPGREREPTATLDPPVRRNFVPSALGDGGSGPGYAPVPRDSIGPIRLPSYLSLSRLEGRAATGSGPAPTTAAPASSYYSTYVPASYPSASLSFPLASASAGGGAAALPISSLFSAPLTGGGTYHATSAFFPLDSTPGDLLGLDWDEWGERLFVATGERVWEWEVDARARRGSATWATL
ncbi:hypothetical protein JCM3774_004389 [Rhodotorula dairenensis]